MDGSSSLAPMTKRLEGKVAIITGGASGIGEATARLFVKHGAKVVIADVQDNVGFSLCEDIGSKEGVSYVHCDVTSESDVQNAVDTAVLKYGKLDIMFSNAGALGKSVMGIMEVTSEELKKVFDVNVFGAFWCAKHAARVMIPAKNGSILFNSSISSVTAGAGPHYYTSSKHAVVGLTKNLCVELGQYGIRVNCISPAAVFTPMLSEALGIKEKQHVEKVAYEASNLKEVVFDTQDAAQAALYLGSDESKYISGLNLVLDGGYSTTNIAFGLAMSKHFLETYNS